MSDFLNKKPPKKDLILAVYVNTKLLSDESILTF